MLVLARKENERVTIGDDISVCVVEIRGDKVRLGFDAPDAVEIHRHEVWRAIQRRRLHAAEQLAARMNAAAVLKRSDWTVDELLSTTDPMLRSAVDAEVWAMRDAA